MLKNYVVVSFIKPFPENHVFDADDFPLHITLVPPFASDSELSTITNSLQHVIDQHGEIQVEILDYVMFGKNCDLPALRIVPNEKLNMLHEELSRMFEHEYRIVFPDTHWMYKDYNPHITNKKNEVLVPGQIIDLHTVSLVEKNGSTKTVMANFKFTQ